MLKQTKKISYGQTFNYVHGHPQSLKNKTFFLFYWCQKSIKCDGKIYWHAIPVYLTEKSLSVSFQVQNCGFLKVILQVSLQDCNPLKLIPNMTQSKARTVLQETRPQVNFIQDYSHTTANKNNQISKIF